MLFFSCRILGSIVILGKACDLIDQHQQKNKQRAASGGDSPAKSALGGISGLATGSKVEDIAPKGAPTPTPTPTKTKFETSPNKIAERPLAAQQKTPETEAKPPQRGASASPRPDAATPTPPEPEATASSRFLPDLLPVREAEQPPKTNRKGKYEYQRLMS